MAPFMKPLLAFFTQIGSPFYINAYPFLAYKSDPSHIDLNYAIFEHTDGIYDAKTKLHYDNMFDAMVDASYAALEKAGFPKVPVRTPFHKIINLNLFFLSNIFNLESKYTNTKYVRNTQTL